VPNETPHSLIVHNARRLFEEAKLLQHNGSNATAVFLSIAAIEESGKSLIQCDPNRMLPKKGKSDHSAKQKIIGEKFDQLFLFEALKQEVDRLESYLKAKGTVENISEFQEMPEEDRLQFVYAMVLKDPSYLKKLIQQAQGPEEHSINFSRDVNRNKVTEKREQAL